MAVFNREVADGIQRAVLTTFNEAEPGVVPSELERLGAVYEISGVPGKELSFAWFRNRVTMRQWVGERQASNAELMDAYMTNAVYESTIKVDVVDIEDGVYALKAKSDVQDLVDAYQIRKSEEIFDLLRNAFGPNGDGTGTDLRNTLDGVPLISPNHPTKVTEFDGSRERGHRWVYSEDTFSNYTNAPLTEDALWAARQTFMTRKNILGQNVYQVPNILLVGPENERAARKMLNMGTKVEDGAAVENETQGLFQLVVDPRVEGGQWFLLDTRINRKPFLFWNRVPLQLQYKDQPVASAAEGNVSDTVFREDAILFGARARMGFGYGLPELIYGSTGEG